MGTNGSRGDNKIKGRTIIPLKYLGNITSDKEIKARTRRIFSEMNKDLRKKCILNVLYGVIWNRNVVSTIERRKKNESLRYVDMEENGETPFY